MGTSRKRLKTTTAVKDDGKQRVKVMKKDDYIKYRGKCKEMAEALCRGNLNLTLKRGHYFCPFWGKQEHWWCVDEHGEVVDPTKDQFPSKGTGIYQPYDGTVACEQCGKIVPEKDIYWVEHHHYCSDRCYAYDIGMGEYL